MLIVLSPSKTLNFDPRPRVKTSTEPMFLDQAETLIDKLRKFSKPRLAELMGISDKLAAENWQRYRDWQPGSNPPGAKQAALAFRGDVYDGLQADKWKAADFKFAQPRLRILSGLYGVLRPLDLMQPYRLEMGTPLKIGRADNLYQFWGTQITHALNEDLAAAKT